MAGASAGYARRVMSALNEVGRSLRDGLDSCIGCGCLSLKRCRLYNPEDRVSELGPGARLLPPMLRRTPAEGV